LLARLDHTQAAQIAALDELSDATEVERATAIPRVAAELSPELVAVLVGSLVRGDSLDGVYRPRAEGAAEAAPDVPKVLPAVPLDPLGRILHRLDDQPAAAHPAIFVPHYQPGDFEHAQML